MPQQRVKFSIHIRILDLYHLFKEQLSEENIPAYKQFMALAG
ncbi:hypothetical protein [Bathymodiolus platifrons methanotrophic gill symbiont]|nr:hypothetical protein [Bathymodiolus platifrons methanotrophic gill symbiont]